MKNMLEELKKLNLEETYEVPITFRKNVIEQIQKDDKHGKMKCIVSALSAVAVVIVVVLVVSQGRIGTGSEKEEKNENGYYDVQLQKPQQTLNDKVSQDETFSKKTLSTENVSVNMDDYYHEIVDLLNINGIEATYEDDEVKAKDNIDNVKTVLFYYNNMVEMTQEGDYVVIK